MSNCGDVKFILSEFYYILDDFKTSCVSLRENWQDNNYEKFYTDFISTYIRKLEDLDICSNELKEQILSIRSNNC